MNSRLNRRVSALLARAQAAEGQSLAEYGLILALLAVVCIGALTVMGSAVAGSSGFVDLPAHL